MNVSTPLSQLLKTVAERGDKVTEKDNDNDERERAALLSAARELVNALESPVERLSRMVYLEVSQTRQNHHPEHS